MIKYPIPCSPWHKDQVVATTPAQSLKFIKAGLAKETCDMHWLTLTYDVSGDIPREKQHAALFLGKGWRKSCGSDSLPAWSLSALIGIAGPEALQEGVCAGVDLGTPDAVRSYLVAYILISINENLLDPKYLKPCPASKRTPAIPASTTTDA